MKKLTNLISTLAILFSLGNFAYSSDREEKSFSESNTPFILIDKSDRKLYFYEKNSISEYPISYGYVPGKKEKAGDHKTPEGEYYICEKHPSAAFHRFLGLSYPNLEDAKNGLEKEIISKSQYETIKNNTKNGRCSWNTSLGGTVGIHGEKKIKKNGENIRLGPEKNWSRGCIITNDILIEELYKKISIGTRVIVRE